MRSAHEQIVTTALTRRVTDFPPGIFLSFRLPIPRAANRPTMFVQIAVHAEPRGVVGTIVPIHFAAVPGTRPPRAPDLVVPHAMLLYLVRRLNRLGIPHLDGVISERILHQGSRRI